MKLVSSGNLGETLVRTWRKYRKNRGKKCKEKREESLGSTSHLREKLERI